MIVDNQALIALVAALVAAPVRVQPADGEPLPVLWAAP